MVYIYIIYYSYYIDEVADVAMAVLPFLLQQKSGKSSHKDFVEFVSVRFYIYIYIYIYIFYELTSSIV